MILPGDMDRLIEQHMAAEMAADTDGAVAVYTDDVVHDVVGWPSGPVQGQAAAKTFYDQLTAVFVNEEMISVHALYGADHCVVEHRARGRFPYGFLSAPPSDRSVEFRMLHVFEFRGDAISRENVWLDTAAVVAQLTAA